VELIFHSAHDPFGGHWAEEEVVIDRYASLEDAAVRNRRRATSDEARLIGAAVTAAVATSEQPVVQTIPEQPQVAAEFHPASDPLLPEETPVELPPRRATIALSELGRDDRDLIVVEDEQPASPSAPAGRARRPEYRQLFSSLRNK
jgi:hypothetical protein